MRFKLSLSQRIVLSFVLLTGVVSGLFAVALTATFHYVEESIITIELQRDLARAIEDFQRGEELRLDEGSSFFTAGPNLPDYLRSIATGYSEIVLEDRAYFVYQAREGATSYFLVKDQTDFEQGEVLLKRAVFGGLVLSLLLSLALGLLLVKQVVAPVRKLTRQVSEYADASENRSPLSPDYADDEVGALARAFDDTLTRLHQALQREALFTSDVSHELRTPLMVINSSCDVLLAREGQDEYTQQRIGAIHRAANEIKDLVETFLALARGKEMATATTSLRNLVNSEFPMWCEMAARKGNRLLLAEEAQGAPRTEKAYPTVLLRTVLANLIRNAIHHTSAGEIVLELRPNGFNLRDTGSGIAADERHRVFEPYYRGGSSPGDGLGLGLSLVRRICEREHWTVVLEENRPHGCIFRLNFF